MTKTKMIASLKTQGTTKKVRTNLKTEQKYRNQKYVYCKTLVLEHDFFLYCTNFNFCFPK